jgi:hypothetical protein
MIAGQDTERPASDLMGAGQDTPTPIKTPIR